MLNLNFSNVKRFKCISYCIWLFVILQLVRGTIDGGLEVVALEIVFTSVTLFIQVVSVIFSEPYKLEESEEQLKQQNELVI